MGKQRSEPTQNGRAQRSFAAIGNPSFCQQVIGELLDARLPVAEREIERRLCGNSRFNGDLGELLRQDARFVELPDGWTLKIFATHHPAGPQAATFS